jgi:hypothetical protein
VVEAEATNLCLQSQTLDVNGAGAPWAYGVGYNSTVTANQTAAPDGTTTADVLKDDSGTGTGSVILEQTITVATNSTYTWSIYAKKKQLQWLQLYLLSFTTPGNGGCYFDLNTGAVGTATAGITGRIVEVAANGFYRVSVTFTTDAADTAGAIRVYLADADNDVTVDRDGTSDVYLWGSQFELGSYATTYQATTTAAVTRDKDILDDQVSGNLTAAAGTVAFQWTPSHNPSGTVALGGSYVDADNYTTILHDATNYIFRKRIAGVNYDATLTASFVSGTTYSIALKLGADGSQIAVDGVLGTANTTGIEGVQYGKLTGVAGTYFSTPDSVANSITGDIDIRAEIAPTDWTPAAVYAIVSKDAQVATSRSYLLYLNADGTLHFAFSADGTANTADVASTAATGFTDGSTRWVRATRVAASGNVNFYTSTDGASWTLLGAADVGTTAGAMFNSTTAVEIGRRNALLYSGNIYRAQIYNGIDGTLAVDFNPADYTHGTTWTSSTTEEVYTMNGNAAVWPAVKLSTRWQWGADGNGGQQAGACFKGEYTDVTGVSDAELLALTA